MAFGKKNNVTGPQRGGNPQNSNPAMVEGKKPSPWVIAVVVVAVVVVLGFGVAMVTVNSNNSREAQDTGASSVKTVDTSRISGMESLTFLDEDAKMRFAVELEDFLTGRGYAWPCTVNVLDKAEQYKNGGTKFYFLTGEGKAWIVLYSPTAASEFSISELNTIVEGVNDEVAVADGDEEDDPSAPKGSGYTVEDEEPAVVDARPSSSSSSSGSSDTNSASSGTSSSSSSNTSSGGSSSSSSGGSSSTGTASVQKIAAGTVPVTDTTAMTAFLPEDAATVFPQAVSQYLAKWDLSASKAKACKGSSSKSGTTYTFNMTAGSHAATVSYDSTKHKFHFTTLY